MNVTVSVDIYLNYLEVLIHVTQGEIDQHYLIIPHNFQTMSA